MIWLDGFTQLHLFHGLLDSEILRKKIALQKKHSLSAPEEEDTRVPPHRIGSSRLNHQTFLRFSFTNTNDS